MENDYYDYGTSATTTDWFTMIHDVERIMEFFKENPTTGTITLGYMPTNSTDPKPS